MKNAILGLGIAVMSIITIMILFTVYGQNTRQNELEDSLSMAVEQTIENLKIDKHYDIANKDELIADLNQNLILSLESDSEVEVRVLAVDYEKGLIDVEVIETYKQPNKTTGKAVCRKTIVVDEKRDNAPTYHFVTFYAPNKDGVFTEYFKYSAASGSDVITPQGTPKLKGYTLKGWSSITPEENEKYEDYVGRSPEFDFEYDEDGSCNSIAGEGTKLIVSSEMKFYAVFEENPTTTEPTTE
ncbi:MAG: hypothetical protein UGF89_10880 [Acutalibacteraceae bacterium]|nr:hypothetical protein [Acutalibacteraceae bacterium]